MNTDDELRELQKLYEEGMLTSEEFANARAMLLDEASEQPFPSAEGQPALAAGTTPAERELVRLDHEWKREREQYMATSRYGVRYMPSLASGIVPAIGLGVIGIAWTFKAISSEFHVLHVVAGIVLFLASVGIAIHRIARVRAYQRAERAYVKRREALLARHPSLDNTRGRRRG